MVGVCWCPAQAQLRDVLGRAAQVDVSGIIVRPAASAH